MPPLARRRVARRRGEVRPGERGGGEPPPEGAPELLRYPENITLANLAYFLAAPTLCYQPVYPRTCVARCRLAGRWHRVPWLPGPAGRAGGSCLRKTAVPALAGSKPCAMAALHAMPSRIPSCAGWLPAASASGRGGWPRNWSC